MFAPPFGKLSVIYKSYIVDKVVCVNGGSRSDSHACGERVSFAVVFCGRRALQHSVNVDVLGLFGKAVNYLKVNEAIGFSNVANLIACGVVHRHRSL